MVIIEEAQNLSTEVLEQIRLLTNLETNQRKLLQIIMVGQPEITEKLSQPQLRQRQVVGGILFRGGQSPRQAGYEPGDGLGSF